MWPLWEQAKPLQGDARSVHLEHHADLPSSGRMANSSINRECSNRPNDLCGVPDTKKACRGRRCGRLFELLNSDWEEECRCPFRLPLGGGAGHLKREALREEVHRFDVSKITKSS